VLGEGPKTKASMLRMRAGANRDYGMRFAENAIDMLMKASSHDPNLLDIARVRAQLLRMHIYQERTLPPSAQGTESDSDLVPVQKFVRH